MISNNLASLIAFPLIAATPLLSAPSPDDAMFEYATCRRSIEKAGRIRFDYTGVFTRTANGLTPANGHTDFTHRADEAYRSDHLLTDAGNAERITRFTKSGRVPRFTIRIPGLVEGDYSALKVQYSNGTRQLESMHIGIVPNRPTTIERRFDGSAADIFDVPFSVTVLDYGGVRVYHAYFRPEPAAALRAGMSITRSSEAYFTGKASNPLPEGCQPYRRGDDA
ncbi:hypothetical protein [Stakelama tenebrarum]|uniref:Uncharacterized protein n=1 Tax=Stakelama tenebrarum TaxID=2711215 RepID=A0A6G6Y2F6_9SPHN|nr:hypothetical protein [Sphingosinithalassobacter tenebrarum]QIG79105.1 hypothetical protein G5C33_04425 [Sphingosinithalassobacter tenebrarum]